MKAPRQKFATEGKEPTRLSDADLIAWANEILRETGKDADAELALSLRDERRRQRYRRRLLRMYPNDERIRAVWGADSMIGTARPARFPTILSGYVPCTASPELVLLNKERGKGIPKAAEELLFDVFAGNRMIIKIMMVIMKFSDISPRSNKAIAELTGYSVEQVEAAKARINYRLDKPGDEQILRLRRVLEGGEL